MSADSYSALPVWGRPGRNHHLAAAFDELAPVVGGGDIVLPRARREPFGRLAPALADVVQVVGQLEFAKRLAHQPGVRTRLERIELERLGCRLARPREHALAAAQRRGQQRQRQQATRRPPLLGAVFRVQVAHDVPGLVQLAPGVRVVEERDGGLAALGLEYRPKPVATLRHGVDQRVQVQLGQRLAHVAALGQYSAS